MSSLPVCLYQETRLNLNPASQNSTSEIRVPSSNGFFASRQSPKRRRLDEPLVTHDEHYFSQQFLAVESAIYFRPHHQTSKTRKSPRAVLWRVLDERNVLELQAVDLYQERAEKDEPLLTLRVTFPNAIRPSGIAFAEKTTEAGSDTPLAFILTESGDLFTLTLSKELFTKQNLGRETGSWLKSSKPSAFGYRIPFRVQSRGHQELWASLTDGAIVKLHSENGQDWRESFYTSGSWKSSLRELIPWKSGGSIRYEDMDLGSNTALSFELSPDGSYLWAVCLDHILRVWNTETGRQAFTQDLSRDDSRDLEKPATQHIPPTRVALLQILPYPSAEQYTVITFSPLTREFKFWLIRDLEDELPDAWEDTWPDCAFIPPIEELENSAIWSMESFRFEISHERNPHCVLWTLIRMGSKCQLYRTSFPLNEPSANVMQSWRNKWVSVDSGMKAGSALKDMLQNPSELEPSSFLSDSTGQNDRWIQFLFYPGRFTIPTLETALVIYRRSLGSGTKASNPDGGDMNISLKDRIFQAVGSLVRLAPADTEEHAYERYQRDLAAQWQVFYKVVKDLHGRRERTLSLSYDSEEELPWLVFADFISPVRQCAEVEILWHNRQSFANPLDIVPGSILLDSLSHAGTSQLGQLFMALDVFRSSFSKGFLWKVDAIIRAEILEMNEATPPLDVIQSICDLSGLPGHVNEDDFVRLTDALQPLGGIGNLDNDLISEALDFLDEAQRGRSHKWEMTRYGARLLISGAQEALQLGEDILLSLLLLVAFIAGDFDASDLSENFDISETFSALALKAKEHGLLGWLAASTLQDSRSDTFDESHGKSNNHRMITQPAGFQQQTILEYLFIGDWATMHDRSLPTIKRLTYWCRAWTFGLRLGERYDKVACHVLGSLMKKNEIQLALQFLRFVPANPWGEYLNGRLCLVTGEFAEAALRLKVAAQGLATGKFLVPAEIDSAGLLDGLQRKQLNDGFARFYQHVNDLFEHARVPSYAGDFAELALRALEDEPSQGPNLKTDILSRLFSACLRTHRFEKAFSALVQQTDMALRKSSLKKLVQDILKANQVRTLLDLPYPADLAADADEQLAALAAKSTTADEPDLFGPTERESKNPAFHKVLYAFRLQRNDLRGAATCLWDRLQIILGEQRSGLRGEDVDEEVQYNYLALINTLSLMDADQAWILTKVSAKEGGRRKVVTLEQVRRQWQEELDRVADLEAGRFSFGLGAGPMEIEA